MGETIRLDLERLQALPLDLPARLTLWRELRALQRRASGNAAMATDAGAADAIPKDTEAADRLDGVLRRLLLSDQLGRCRELALQGAWRDASQRLTGLDSEADALGLMDALGQLLLELLEPLQRLLLAPAAAGAGSGDTTVSAGHGQPATLDAEDRAELLWQAHSWLRLLRERGLLGDGHGTDVAAQAEPIARLGAITWLECFQQANEPAGRLQALLRSQTLLIALAEAHQPCPDWVAPALRAGLRAGLTWLGRGVEPAELLRWSQAYVASVLPEHQRDKARQQLTPAETAMEIGEALQIRAFRSSPVF